MHVCAQVCMCPPSRTPLPPPSPPHPSGVSQCTSPEHPVSCIKPGLAIYFTYDNIHVSVLFSHHPTLAFSHRVQKSVLYMNLFCGLLYTVIVTIFLNSIYVCYYTVLVFFFRLTSLCIVGSSFNGIFAGSEQFWQRS